MRYPLENAKTRITSPFGWRVHPVSKKRTMHYGVDYGASEGTTIYTIEDGIVIESRLSTAANGGYGEYVKVKHPNGDVSTYAHMIPGSRAVKKGDKVVEGQMLGKVGESGNTTGPHLHWEVAVKGSPVNPIVYVENGMKKDKPRPVIRTPESRGIKKPAAPAPAAPKAPAKKAPIAKPKGE